MNPSDFYFSSGLCGLDSMLQGLKPGHNVVLKVGAVADYLPLIKN